MPKSFPFPADENRVLRDANYARAFTIYQGALKHAEHEAKNWPKSATTQPQQLTWVPPLDLCIIDLQPVQPIQKLISPLGIKDWTNKAKNSSHGRIFAGRDFQIPDGVLFSDMRVQSDRRRAQILFSNGLFCNFGDIQSRSHNEASTLNLHELVIRIAFTLKAARDFYLNANYVGDVALRIQLENLGFYSVNPITNIDWHRDDSTGFFDNWCWNYLLNNRTLKGENCFNIFSIEVAKDICWGMGDQIATFGNFDELASQLGLTLPKKK